MADRGAPHLAVQILSLDGAGYVPGPVTSAGSALATTIDAGKPFGVSFDPADLLVF